ncbi:unnamed protein product [Amoebophrya sp. A120]|nr:unnamed protein product [Amoebophrya sp. A120]|eukprot:GSA120T00005076001.1
MSSVVQSPPLQPRSAGTTTSATNMAPGRHRTDVVAQKQQKLSPSTEDSSDDLQDDEYSSSYDSGYTDDDTSTTGESSLTQDAVDPSRLGYGDRRSSRYEARTTEQAALQHQNHRRLSRQVQGQNVAGGRGPFRKSSGKAQRISRGPVGGSAIAFPGPLGPPGAASILKRQSPRDKKYSMASLNRASRQQLSGAPTASSGTLPRDSINLLNKRPPGGAGGASSTKLPSRNFQHRTSKYDSTGQYASSRKNNNSASASKNYGRSRIVMILFCIAAVCLVGLGVLIRNSSINNADQHFFPNNNPNFPGNGGANMNAAGQNYNYGAYNNNNNAFLNPNNNSPGAAQRELQFNNNGHAVPRQFQFQHHGMNNNAQQAGAAGAGGRPASSGSFFGSFLSNISMLWYGVIGALALTAGLFLLWWVVL